MVTVLCVDDFVQAHQSLVKADDVVQDLLVDFVCIFELAQIDALGGTYDLDLGGAACVLARWRIG
jgi:hypothetical protein